jgi:hypothetical protein
MASVPRNNPNQEKTMPEQIELNHPDDRNTISEEMHPFQVTGENEIVAFTDEEAYEYSRLLESLADGESA